MSVRNIPRLRIRKETHNFLHSLTAVVFCHFYVVCLYSFSLHNSLESGKDERKIAFEYPLANIALKPSSFDSRAAQSPSLLRETRPFFVRYSKRFLQLHNRLRKRSKLLLRVRDSKIVHFQTDSRLRLCYSPCRSLQNTYKSPRTDDPSRTLS